MDLWSSAFVSLLLLAAAAGLMTSHARTWRSAREEPLEPGELEFCRRQFRRRMQTSAMLGLLGVAIFVGQVLTLWIVSRLFVALYLAGILALLGWVVLLALADILATKYHFGRLRDNYKIEQAKLQAEVRRIRAREGNGRK